MGKRVFGTLFFVLIASTCVVTAQERAGVIAADTGSGNRIVLLDPGVSLGRAVFLLPPSLGPGLSFRDPSMMFSGDAIFTGGPLSGGVLEPRADLMSPLRLQMDREKNLSPFRMVLGAVETGAVGYMAYRHIKKYGLFR
jgi:hypothetical protein